MKKQIRDLLKAHGPCLTSELIHSMEKQGITNAAARQRITRAGSEYNKLAGLRFTKNARFIYLDEQYGNLEFWQALERAFEVSGKSYWGAVVGLKARGGVCPKSMFSIVCGAPINRKNQLSPDRILERLSAINFIEEEKNESLKEVFIKLKPNFYTQKSTAEIKAIMLAEFVVIQAVKDWAKRIGFGSYNKFKVRGEEDLPIVSGIAWDITSPSYMRPLVSAREGKMKPGFFVCDVILNGVIDDDQVNLFVRKHDMASAPMKVAPILPFLIGDGFTNSAFDNAKSKGIAALTVSNLFGGDISKALNDLIKLLSDTGATAAVNLGHLDKVMTELTKIEGAANNLRGALFELVVGNLVKEVEGGFLGSGIEKTHYPTGRKVELDVILDKEGGETSLVIECKAKIPGSKVSLMEAKKWYSDRVPLIFDILSHDLHYLDKNIEFEIWTNGTFHNSAEAWLNKQKTNFEGYSVSWKDGTAVKKYMQRARNKSIKKIMDEHYFKNPLTKLNV